MKKLFLLLILVAPAFFSNAQDLTALIDKCSPSIFKITTYDAAGNEYAVGTGFFISATGTALSNYHVFQGAAKAKIKTSDNKVYLVENVLGWSKESDLIKFNVKNELNEVFPFLKMNSVSPKSGEKIFIIGNPLGLEKTVADGIVSSIRQDEKMGETIQITAPISHGNSGSPLMNMTGEALGVVTYYLESGQNLNFAVSVKNLNILDPINAYKFPPEDGVTNVVSSNNGSNQDNNTNTGGGTDYYALSTIIFCESVDDYGSPKTEATTFNISGDGGNVTVYIDNGGEEMHTTGFYAKIYKKGSGGLYDQFIEKKSYTITSTIKATYFKYFFSEAGDYMISCYNNENAWINDGYVTIKNSSSGDTNSGLSFDYNDPTSTFYFMDSKIEFCTELDSYNACKNAGDVFYIGKNGSYIYVWVSNGTKVFKSDGFKVELYKKKGKDYDEYVSSKNYDINSEKAKIYFEYSLYDAGDFKMKIYTKEDVWVQDAYLTVKWK